MKENKYSIRRIELIRNNKLEIYDLLDFFIFGNVDSNPYLQQEDQIKLYLIDKTINISPLFALTLSCSENMFS